MAPTGDLNDSPRLVDRGDSPALGDPDESPALVDDDLDPQPTAQPSERPTPVDGEEKVVPVTNVGGAAPTPLGLDSGGDLPGPEDDLENLAEPEPPEPPEVGALHVRRGQGPEE